MPQKMITELEMKTPVSVSESTSPKHDDHSPWNMRRADGRCRY